MKKTYSLKKKYIKGYNMTETERNRIISEEYADLIVDYTYNYDKLKDLEDSTLNPINSLYSVIHVPVALFGVDSISRFGYYTIPSCYGLLSNEVNKTTVLNTAVGKLEELNSLNPTGRGVLIGFIDTGIDYTHPAFLDTRNHTRIASIWDQTIQSEATTMSSLNFGTEYSRIQINEALRSPNPFDIVPSKDEIGHGTMLAGFAAGSANPLRNFVGTAPGAELAVVKLKEAKSFIKDFYEIPKEATCYQENDIILGIKYLDQVARTLSKPLIICLGVGASLGDHSGGRVISRFLSEVSTGFDRSVVVAGGNEGNRGTHYFSNYMASTNNEEVYLRVGEDTKGFSLQFLGVSPNYFWIDLYGPGNAYLSRVPPVDKQTAVINFESTTIHIDALLNIPYFYDQSIILRFHNPEPGDWKFHIYSSTQELSMNFHFWLPLHNFLSDKTFFLKPDNFTTLTDPSNNKTLISTVAYNPTNLTLEYNSGKGFNISDDPKPDLTAPGVNIVCPYPNNQYVLGAGSSLSAGFTAGVSARVFEWALVQENLPEMNHSILKKTMIQSAFRFPNIEYPNREWGYGILTLDRMKTMLEILASLNIRE